MKRSAKVESSRGEGAEEEGKGTKDRENKLNRKLNREIEGKEKEKYQKAQDKAQKAEEKSGRQQKIQRR